MSKFNGNAFHSKIFTYLERIKNYLDKKLITINAKIYIKLLIHLTRLDRFE